MIDKKILRVICLSQDCTPVVLGGASRSVDKYTTFDIHVTEELLRLLRYLNEHSSNKQSYVNRSVIGVEIVD